MILVIAQSYKHAHRVMQSKDVSGGRWKYLSRPEYCHGLHNVKVLQLGFGVNPEITRTLQQSNIEIVHKVQDVLPEDHYCPYCRGTGHGKTNPRTEKIGVVWYQCPCPYCRPEDYQEARNDTH